MELNTIAIISDSVTRAGLIGRQITGLCQTRSYACNELHLAGYEPQAIIDIDLERDSSLSALSDWLIRAGRPKKLIVTIDRGIRRQAVQACALNATHLIERPIWPRELIPLLLDGPEYLGRRDAALPMDQLARTNRDISGIDAMDEVFGSASASVPLNLGVIQQAGANIVTQIESSGIIHWLNTVKRHHSSTYRHCLLVTGVAVAFGERLGFSRDDRAKVAICGLLHDIGKAFIPVSVLEKPGALTDDEVLLMQQHPVSGFKALEDIPEIDPDYLDVVLHHHEYLDGSGYPHGLKGEQLSDIVRMLTISDIFAALTEYRPYKKTIAGDAAYSIIQGMGDKLDRDLVLEFEPLQVVRAAQA
jgi:putative nucleotidyltransferase with HDIG domain